MMKRKFAEIILALLLAGMLTLAFNIQPVKASGTVYIRADGSIDPPDAPISSVDNITYTLTGNISSDADGIVVEKSSIVFDGDGYTLQGSGGGNGFSLGSISSVTITNTNIRGFYYGVYLNSVSYGVISKNNFTGQRSGAIGLNEYSNCNIISENNIAHSPYGIGLAGSFNTVSLNTIEDQGDGIILSGSNNNISKNNIRSTAAGISVFSSNHNTLHENSIVHNIDKGIRLYGSSNNTISGNKITDNGDGILVSGSSNNSISENTITNNGHTIIASSRYGIGISYSSANTVKGNNMANNTYNFGVAGTNLTHFINNVDVSNTVDGKPSYYWINKQDMEVPIDAGFVALINCTHMIAQNLNLTHNGQGILLASTTNSTIINNNVTDNESGIELYWSSNQIISDNRITANENGISLSGSFNNTVSGNNLINNRGNGIVLGKSSNNSVTGNNMANNGNGVRLDESISNEVFRNNITVSYWGILLYASSTSTFSENLMNGNKYGFGISGFTLSDFMHCIDVSNLVDGKPIYYLVNQKNLVINPVTHPKVGYLAFINCINITVEGLILTNQGQGILLVNTNNSKIIDNDITNNSDGLRFWGSSGITVMGNNITNNFNGIRFDSSFNNTISKNSVTNNIYGVQLFQVSNTSFSKNDVMSNRWDGIMLSSSNNNTIVGNNIRKNAAGITFYNSLNNTILGNNITNNEYSGISLQGSSNNKIYHNNFINNTRQVEVFPEVEIPAIGLKIPPSINTWDNGYPSGGNYWNDYNGTDYYTGKYQNETGSDGIGDMPHTIDANNTDHYPLMAPISFFNAGTWNDMTYYVHIVSNSTISDFYFNPGEGAFLRFNVTGEEGIEGFCRVTIPKDLLWVEDGWTILVGDQPTTDYRIIPDENYTYLYFTYNHSTKTVLIQGTHVIPEFPSTMIPLLFVLATLIATVLLKKKRHSQSQPLFC